MDVVRDADRRGDAVADRELFVGVVDVGRLRFTSWVDNGSADRSTQIERLALAQNHIIFGRMEPTPTYEIAMRAPILPTRIMPISPNFLLH